MPEAPSRKGNEGEQSDFEFEKGKVVLSYLLVGECAIGEKEIWKRRWGLMLLLATGGTTVLIRARGGSIRNIIRLEVRGPSGPQLLAGGPSGRLDFVLRALWVLRPCDPHNWIVSLAHCLFWSTNPKKNCPKIQKMLSTNPKFFV